MVGWCSMGTFNDPCFMALLCSISHEALFTGLEVGVFDQAQTDRTCVNTFATATGLVCATYVSYVPSYDPCIYTHNCVYIRSIWYIIMLYIICMSIFYIELSWILLFWTILYHFISLEILYTSQTGARIMCVIVSDSVRIMLCGLCL